MHGRESRTRRGTRALAGSLRAALGPARLLLAAKTTLAVGLAWVIAPHMPGVTEQYPYYAPLGALISMYPTLIGSARSALQTLAGLIAGIALAGIVLLTVGPNLWSIPLVVGVGVLLAGTGWFGAAREYVPVAALFVLIVGGQNADDYSLGYLTQMAVGIGVGLLINALIPPAPLTAHALRRVDELQSALADHLHEVAEALAETWPPERDAWVRGAGELGTTAGAVRRAIAEADESRRGNPRAWRGRAGTGAARSRLDALDRTAHHLREISDALAEGLWDPAGTRALDPGLAEPIAAACTAVAAALAHDSEGGAEAHRVRADAARALRQLTDAVASSTPDSRSVFGPGALVTMHLRRVFDLSRGRPAPRPSPDDRR